MNGESLLNLVSAIFGFGVTFWYIFVYSSYGRKGVRSVQVGTPLPRVQFENVSQEVVTLEGMQGSKTLIVFFRANWCPLCMAQLNEIQAQAERLSAAGVQVKFVSNQPHERSAELAEKLQLPEHFEMLVDVELSAARELGIEDIGGTPVGMPGYPADTVMATVLALDENNVVIWGDETDNYRVRPNPDIFLPVFEQQRAGVDGQLMAS